jgi:hypothetical protein
MDSEVVKMAGDWIKVERCTPDKPEVLRIARRLEIDRDAAFGKLFRFWSWLDGNCVDGIVDGVASTDVDAVVGVPGFTKTLEGVGWLEIDDTAERITVSNFARHNGATAKARASKARRMATYRAKKEATVDGSVDGIASTKASTTPSTGALPREEKRIEEKNIKNKPPIPPQEKKGGDAVLSVESFETNPGAVNGFAGPMVIPCEPFRRYIKKHAKKTHYLRAAKAWNKVILDGADPEAIIAAYDKSPRVVQATETKHIPNPEAYLLDYVFLDPPIEPEEKGGDNFGFTFS